MVNPNIFSQFAAPRSIADYQGDAQRREANALTLEGVKRKNAMEDMALQQGQAKQNALMQIMQGWTPKTTAQERAASLRTNPLTYGDADAIEKADLEAQKTRAGISAQDAESLTKNLGVLKRLTGAVMSDPTPENARAAIQMWEQLTGKQLPQERERVAFLQTPEQVRSWAAGYAMEADKLLPQLSTQNLGGNMASVSRDPLSGAVTTNALTPITQSADNAATNATRVAEGAANRGVTVRGQNLTRQNALDRIELDNRNLVTESGGPDQVAMTRKFGKAPPGWRWKPDGSQEAIPGGPADIKAGAEGEKRALRQKTLVAQADSVLDEIAQAKSLAGWNTTGVGGVLASLPMTDARKLAGHVETIKANLGFDRLQQMRDMSPTGGALGQVAVQELSSLQATVAKLDQLQKPSEVVAALEKIERSYQRWKETLGGSTGGATGSFADDKPPAGDIDALLKKYGGKK